MNPIPHLVRLSFRAYKLLVSPVLHTLAGPMGGCRFTPTCSEYAAEAIQQHGGFLGARLTVLRLCRCHPWGGCGHDPVPAEAGKSRLHPMEQGNAMAVKGHWNQASQPGN